MDNTTHTDHEVLGPFGAPVPASEEQAQLRSDELNLFDATAVAVSSVAPAYSLASTLAYVFIALGVSAVFGPSVIVVSFIPVLFVAIAYFHLNRRDPDCGASYSWLSKVIHPFVGWFNGWVQVATSAIFCISASILAGQYTLQLFNSLGWINSATASSVWYTSLIGIAWLVLITSMCVYGIRWTTNFQWILVIIEYSVVILFSLWGIYKAVFTHPAGSTGFHLSWLNPFEVTSWSALAAGIALGVFFFWGWDTAVNLNEETKNRTHTPGHAGILAMFLLLVVFLINFVSVEMLIPQKVIEAQGSNILFYYAEHVFGTWAGYVMIFAVITSTVATTQTTLLPASRITLSMARDKVFPHVFARIHPKFQTPAVGIITLACFTTVGIILNSGSPSVNSIIGRLILDIGVLVAFYYGMTGIACGWAYRKVAFKKFSFFFTGVLLPFLSGLFLLYVCYEVIVSNGWGEAIPILVTLGLGIPLALVARFTTKGDFFKVKPIAYDSIEEPESTEESQQAPVAV